MIREGRYLSHYYSCAMPLTEQNAAHGLIRSNSFLNGLVSGVQHELTIVPKLSAEPSSFQDHAFDAELVALVHWSRLKVLLLSCFPQIDDVVVIAHAVDVVDHVFRPPAMSKQPSKAVGAVMFVRTERDADITGRVFIPDRSVVSLAPDQAGEWIVREPFGYLFVCVVVAWLCHANI